MWKCLIIFVTICKLCENAKILGIIPTPSYSHQIVYRPIFRALADRGHEVVLLTTDTVTDPTYKVKQINLHDTYKIWSPYTKAFSDVRSHFSMAKLIKRISIDIVKYQLQLSEVQMLLNNETEHFDLVMSEVIQAGMLGFAEKFKCPSIGLFSMDLYNELYDLFGSPIHPVAYADILAPIHQIKMSFWGRLFSTIQLYSFQLGTILEFNMVSEESEMMDKYFGIRISPKDLIRKLSVVFVNAVPTLNLRPVGPMIINIGGNLQIEPQKKLPKEYQDFLDSARNGAIYFSLGTNVKSHVVPPEMRQAFLDAFRDLSYKVLWKFDIVDLPNVPENVKIVEWAPQQDILRHPNIKLFIFQGGLQSYEEAVYNKIPLVGIPFLGDQDSNVERLVGSGYGVKIDKHNVTKESVIEAIHEVINNPSYKQKITETSELIADQPMTGLEKAVWWTEYVLRHKGAHHLRSPVMDLPFYQYYLLDVLGFLLGCIILAIVVVYKLCKLIGRLLFKTKAKKVKVK